MNKKNSELSLKTPQQFHEYAAQRAKAPNAGAVSKYAADTPAVIKSLGALVDKDESDGQLRVVISTAERDRDRDTINQDGWDLKNYRANPVILFAHDHSIPAIGRARNTFVEDGRLISYPEFMPEDMNPFAASVGKMVAGGWMKATSVGFLPKAWVFNEDENGVDFSQQELLEYSIVPVPANPQALLEAKKAKIDLRPIKEWAEKTLDSFNQEGFDIALPRELVEKLYQSIESNSKTIIAPASVAKKPEESTTKIEHPSSEVTVKVGSMEITFKETAKESALLSGDVNALTPSAGHVKGEESGGQSSPPTPLTEKSGRVLSKENETAIRNAYKALGDVLAKLERAEIVDDGDDSKSSKSKETKEVEAAAAVPVEKWFEGLASDDSVLSLQDEEDDGDSFSASDLEFLKSEVREQVQSTITKLTGKVF